MPPKTEKKGHAPLSSGEVDDILARINEMSDTVQQVLNTDTKAEERRKQERLEKRKEEKRKMEIDRNFNRYNPSEYHRLEDDEFIEKLLKEVDEPPKPKHQTHTDLTQVETVALREAERLKQEGNTHFKAQEWQEAFDKYSYAIGMDPEDDDLRVALHNNRAAMSLKLVGKEMQAVEDASWVLTHQRHNQKALLRRATALCRLHRPTEALVDVHHVLNGDSKNVEAKELLKKAKWEEKELNEYNKFAKDHASIVEDLGSALDKASVLLSKAIADSTPEPILPPAPEEPPALTPEEEERKVAADLAALEAAMADDSPLPPQPPAPTTTAEDAAPVEAPPVEQPPLERLPSKAVEDLTSNFCDIVAIASGTADCASVLIRLKGFIPLLLQLIPFLAMEVESTTESQNQKKKNSKIDPTTLVFVAATYRMLGAAFAHPVARAIVEEDPAMLSAVLDVALTGAQSMRPVSTAAALELMSTLCTGAVPRRYLLPKVSTEQMDQWGSDPSCGLGYLHFLEKILLEGEEASSKYITSTSGKSTTEEQRVATLLSQIGSAEPHAVGQRTAAMTMLLRLSATLSIVTVLSSDKMSSKLVAAMIKEVKLAMGGSTDGGALTPSNNAYVLEGLFAVGFNCIRSSAENKTLWAKLLHQQKVPALLCDYLSRYTALFNNDDKKQSALRDDLVNVVARLCGVLAKIAFYPDIREYLIKNAMETLVTLLCKLGPQKDETGDRQYHSAITENLTLALATVTRQTDGVIALWAVTTSPAVRKQMVSIVLSTNFRTIGNAALIIPVLDPASLDAEHTVASLLTAIKDLRTKILQAESTAGANTKTNPQIAAEARASAQEASSAQKNCGIALSKLAKNEPMLIQLREQRGLEILATTMKL